MHCIIAEIFRANVPNASRRRWQLYKAASSCQSWLSGTSTTLCGHSGTYVCPCLSLLCFAYKLSAKDKAPAGARCIQRQTRQACTLKAWECSTLAGKYPLRLCYSTDLMCNLQHMLTGDVWSGARVWI